MHHIEKTLTFELYQIFTVTASTIVGVRGQVILAILLLEIFYSTN